MFDTIDYFLLENNNKSPCCCFMPPLPSSLQTYLCSRYFYSIFYVYVLKDQCNFSFSPSSVISFILITLNLAIDDSQNTLSSVSLLIARDAMLFDIRDKYCHFKFRMFTMNSWFYCLIYHQAHIISNQTSVSHFEFPIFHTQSSSRSIPQEASKLFTSFYPHSEECMLISLIWSTFIREEWPCFSLFYSSWTVRNSEFYLQRWLNQIYK